MVGKKKKHGNCLIHSLIQKDQTYHIFSDVYLCIQLKTCPEFMFECLPSTPCWQQGEPGPAQALAHVVIPAWGTTYMCHKQKCFPNMFFKGVLLVKVYGWNLIPSKSTWKGNKYFCLSKSRRKNTPNYALQCGLQWISFFGASQRMVSSLLTHLLPHFENLMKPKQELKINTSRIMFHCTSLYGCPPALNSLLLIIWNCGRGGGGGLVMD